MLYRSRSVVDGPPTLAEQLGRGAREGFDNLVTVASVALIAVPIGGEGVLAARVGTSAASTSRALVPYFPTNNGFLFAPIRTFLQPGQLMDRFGGSALSRFFSPAGTAVAARSLPPATAGMELRTFEVLKALEVDSGLAAPAFGQFGLGTQYRTTLTLQELVEQGFIREVVR